MTPIELLKHWRYRVHRVQLAHYEAGRKFSKYHLSLGLPAIALNTIVGTTVFSSIGQFSSSEHITWITVLVGLLSVISAVLVSLQTFLRYSDLSEKHRVAGARFANLKHRIELLGTMPPTDTQDLKSELTKIEEEWNKFRQDSPNIPFSIWSHIENTLTYEVHEERYPNFAEAIHDNN